MNRPITDFLQRVEEAWFLDTPVDMTEREMQMWADIAVLIGIVKGLDAARPGQP